MSFDFFCTIVTQPILWFSLNHFIYEISCFDTPVSWDFTFFNLNLFWQNVISNFLTWFSDVRASSIHALICHDSNCEIIHWGRVVLTAHNLWSHISWRTRCILSIFRSPDSCNPKICYSYIAVHVDDQIFWFYVSVDNLFFMAVF